MRRVCSVATVRRAEAGVGVPEPILMARASTALAGVGLDLLRARRGAVRGGRVVALIGSGNNGGDALWAMAALAGRGVRAVAVGDPARMHGPGAAAARSAGVRVMPWGWPEVDGAIASADLALDGLVGIGGTGSLREPAAGAVRALVAAGVPIVAVDVPSGIEPDTGAVSGEAVPAAVTVCFGVLKPGLLVPPARDHAGIVTVVDIGLRAADLEPAAWVLDLPDLAVRAPAADAHKYRRGVVGITSGSAQYPGAAMLCVGGARRSGVGMVALAGAGSAPGPAAVVARYPDVVLAVDRAVDARCVGPGLGQSRESVEAVLRAMSDAAPLVIDASGLTVLARQEGRQALAERAEAGLITVLTPHAGEFARIGLDPAGGPLLAAPRAADATGAVVVLKGPGTVIAAPGSVPYVDTLGEAHLATAGSGDVLAGLLTGMLAAACRAACGAPAPDGPHADGGLTHTDVALVAARAVGLHGLAGRLAAAQGGPVTATDVLEQLGRAHAVAGSAGG